MRTFILIGKSRKTGKDELILGREAKGSEHIEAYKELGAQRVSEDYENVVLVEAAPFKRPLKFITKAEAEAKADEEKKAKEAAAKAADKKPKAEAEAKAKSPAKKKNAADKTETKTGTDTGSNSET